MSGSPPHGSDAALPGDRDRPNTADAEWDDPFFTGADPGSPAPASGHEAGPTPLQVNHTPPPLSLVETAFLASTASLLWLASYYLSLVPWMRILFPLPAALVYLRWGGRAAWMATLVTGLLLSVLMGPYLSLLFLIPYGLLGVQLGMSWKRNMSWLGSISTGTLLATAGFFVRMWMVSLFLSEDLWAYLTNRISDFVVWLVSRLVDWGILGVGALGTVNLQAIQIFAVGAVLLSDLVYVFTIHLAAWVLLSRLGNPIPQAPRWVQVIFEEE
ncbi:DUF2232 domain-containing protein [Leptolyngbya sp. AN02str]|uniref:DUF2232 domain-containing protein n=1 Tax=Leptolyngbya sp. AN02str TaxID=3423363 RepID=UPI003D31F6BF